MLMFYISNQQSGGVLVSKRGVSKDLRKRLRLGKDIQAENEHALKIFTS